MRNARALDDRRPDRTSSSSTTRAGPARCWPSTTTSRSWSRSCATTDQLKNTLIVFVSDNGWLQGEHRITGDKFLPYEESLRVPLILRGPGVPAGQTVQGQVSNVDFAPTLLDAAGASAGRTMDGVSLLPTARNPSRRPEPGARDRGPGAAVRRRHPDQRAGTGPTRGCAPTATPTSSGPGDRREGALRPPPGPLPAQQRRRRSGLRARSRRGWRRSWPSSTTARATRAT